ncbi:MAG: hypothetical protein O8C66_02025 [Candidatus Methanoperedens sp.]|nr:hypothetical protein [Candidatus Methanoperedens sp.]MCZ7369263.1 hypothetical protein [Candidatus Methanoperedens sp.]
MGIKYRGLLLILLLPAFIGGASAAIYVENASAFDFSLNAGPVGLTSSLDGIQPRIFTEDVDSLLGKKLIVAPSGLDNSLNAVRPRIFTEDIDSLLRHNLIVAPAELDNSLNAVRPRIFTEDVDSLWYPQMAPYSPSPPTPSPTPTPTPGPIPTTTIITPAPNSYFTLGDPIAFAASVQGGTAPYSYVWTSNIDGQIGRSETISANDLSVGEHRITLSVKDNTGNVGTSSVNIMISTSMNAPVASGIKPEAWGYFLEGVDANLNITGDVSDPDGISDINNVVFTVGGKDYVASKGADGWSTQINAGSLSNREILSVTAYDKEGHKSDAKTLQIKTVKIPWLLNPFIEVQSDNGKLLYSFSGNFDSSNVLGDGWSSTTPNNIPIFGGYEHTINPPQVTVAGVWSTDGYGEISALLDMDMEFSGVKSKWKPSEAGVVKDLIKDMTTQFASGKYSYCSTYPGLCMKRSRYMLNGEIEVGGSGEVIIKTETLTLDQLRAFLNLSFEAEIPTPYSLNIPVAGNQGVVIVVGPHGSIESVYEFSNNTMSLSNRMIQIGVSGGGKFKLGDEGGELIPLYVEIYVIGDLNVIIIYTEPAKNDVNLCLSGEAGAKARAGWSWFGNTWEGKIGPYTYPDGCKSGLKSSISSLSTLKQASWKWDMMRSTAKMPLSTVSALAISKPDNAIMYDDYPDDFPAIAANKNGSALAVWVHGTDISVMPPKMSIYYSFWNGANWSDPESIHSDNTSVLNPKAVYYDDSAVSIWTGDKGKLDINDTFDNWTSTLEIYYSFWNGTSWTVPDKITNDTEADGMPSISSDGKNVTVVWMHDSDSNVDTKNDLDIHYSIWNGTAWSQPAALTSDNLQDFEPRLAQRSDGTAIAVWTRDMDGNSSTDEDKEIYYSFWDGIWSIPAPLTENQFKDSKPYPAFNGTVPAVAWVQSQEIPINVSYFNQTSNQTEYTEINVSKDSVLFSEFKNGIWTAPINISDQDFSISDVSISSDEKGDLIAAWRGYNNGDGDIKYTVRDSFDLLWSPERRLTNDSLINWKLSMDTTANKSIFVWLKHNSSIVFDNNTGLNLDSTFDDVYYSVLEIKPDLSIVSEDINVTKNFKIGDTIPINFTVRNIGVLNSGKFTIQVFDGTPDTGIQTGGDIIADSIIPGGEYNVSIIYNISKINTSTYVVLDPLNKISEISKTNNMAYRNISVLPDLRITPEDFSLISNEADRYRLDIRMQNIGGVSASNVYFEVYEDYPPNGTLVYTGVHDVPTGGTNVSLSLNLTNGSHLIYAILDPENKIEEIGKMNNDAAYLIKALPDLMISSPLMIYDSQNKTATVNATLRNIGFARATNISVALINYTDANSSLDNASVLYRWNVDLLDANEHLPISAVIEATESTKIVLNADSNNTIQEIDEFNNIAYGSVSITVNPLPPTIEPASVIDLKNISYASSYINWTWIDPQDSDFSKVMIYLNGAFQKNVTRGDQYYNATGLTPNTLYEISTRTVDVAGNINQTWVYQNATTAPLPDDTAPDSITNLRNTTYASTYINWTWTDPSNPDFVKVIVYLDGIYKDDVLKGVKYYNATGLVPATYTIGTRTVDASGNINATMVTHTATTILPLVRFINGTVTDSVNKTGIPGVKVSTNISNSTTTNALGFYSFAVTSGTYNITASFEPTYYTNITTVSTALSAVVVQDIELFKKPTGTITGIITNS